MLSSAAAANPFSTSATKRFLSRDFAGALAELPGTPHGEAAILKGRTLTALKRYNEAARAFARALLAAPYLADYAHFYRAEALRLAKRYGDAAAAYLQAASVPGSRMRDRALWQRGDSLHAAGRYKEAITSYQTLIDSYGDHPRMSALQLAQARSRIAAGERSEAAVQLRKIWLSWPHQKPADTAKATLDSLVAAGVRIQPATLSERFRRIRWFRRVKQCGRALAELRELKTAFPKDIDRIDYQVARTLRRDSQPGKAVPVLRALMARTKSPSIKRRARWLLVDSLAWSGKVDEAIKLLSERIPAKPKRKHVSALKVLARVLADHGRNKEALAHTETIGKLTSPRAVRHQLAWLAYRAGEYALAATRFAKLKRKRRPRPYTLYWEARARQRAGQLDEAEKLYNQLLERHLRSYYGHQARSRLTEMGRLNLIQGKCPAEITLPKRADVESTLGLLTTRFGELVPDLRRALGLWQIGLRSEARRELRVIGIDVTWALYRGRKRQYNVRNPVERLWRGQPLPKRNRWRPTPAEKKLHKLDAEARTALLKGLGGVMQGAGLAYWGWRLGPRDKNNMRHFYPRAFGRMVVATAKRFDIDPNILWAIMRTESAYRTDAISRVWAGGLMQLMPHTAVRLAKELRMRFSPEQVFDPRVNLTLAGYYLRAVSAKFNGQLPLVAAAYNGGPHNVARWLRARGKDTELDAFIEEIPFDESRRYAKKIVRLRAVYERTYCNKDDMLLSNELNPLHSRYPNY